jgi:hypothetical protein
MGGKPLSTDGLGGRIGSNLEQLARSLEFTAH